MKEQHINSEAAGASLTRRGFLRLGASAVALSAAATALPGFSGMAIAEDAAAQDNPLIGALEGPEVITDPAQFPKSFAEAPKLAELVKAGKLPALKDRLPEDPLVIKPLHEVGAYGGTWRRGFTGPGDKWNGGRAAGHDNLVFWDYKTQQIVPNIAKGWEFNADKTQMTLHLRKGMKWSDGQPFTADDIVFWYTDLYQNKEMTPSAAAEMTIAGKPVTVEKVDDLTVHYNFPAPYEYFLTHLTATSPSCGGQAANGQYGGGGYAPKHYLSRFHPTYAGADAVKKLAADAGFDSWVALFKAKADWALNPDLPVVTAWKTASPVNTPNWTLERNPYSIWVDTAGNQLPYIDTVSLTLAQDAQVLNLRAIAGEFDVQERGLLIENIPVFLENKDKSGYTLHLDPGDYGSDALVSFNMAYQGDPEIVKLFARRDFRRALSLASDRDQINEAVFLGVGKPSTIAPSDTNKYFPGADYRTRWATKDVDKANALLDGIGLTKKDGDGYRLRSDGKRIQLEILVFAAQFINQVKIAEMLRDQWQQVGVALDIKQIERSQGANQIAQDAQQLWIWSNGGSEEIFTNNYVVPLEVSGYQGVGNGLAKWILSGGKEGVEPPEAMKQAMQIHRGAKGLAEAERIDAGKKFWRICVDEVWQIGLVGFAGADSGLRVVTNKLGNDPARQINSINVRSPGTSRPETFYFKS